MRNLKISSVYRNPIFMLENSEEQNEKTAVAAKPQHHENEMLKNSISSSTRGLFLSQYLLFTCTTFLDRNDFLYFHVARLFCRPEISRRNLFFELIKHEIWREEKTLEATSSRSFREFLSLKCIGGIFWLAVRALASLLKPQNLQQAKQQFH